jgi:hypothetical protein
MCIFKASCGFVFFFFGFAPKKKQKRSRQPGSLRACCRASASCYTAAQVLLCKTCVMLLSMAAHIPATAAYPVSSIPKLPF